MPEQIRLKINYSQDKQWIGGTIYIENLLWALAELPPEERPILYFDNPANLPSKLVDRLASDIQEPPQIPVTNAVRRVYRFIPLPEWLRVKVHLLKEAATPRRTGSNPVITFPAWHANPSDRSSIYWIPDFQHIHLPKFFQPDEIKARNEVHRRISRCNSIVVLSSSMAQKDFHALYPDAAARTRRWSFCSGLTVKPGPADFDPRPHFGLPRHYLYVPNQFWAHKDHPTLLKALVLLRKRGLRPFVVCTGYQHDYRNPDYFPSLMKFISENGLEDQTRVLGLVPREQQVQVFRHAAAVIQPSLFEGWSTVIEDAKAVGRPIIASDFPVHLEQLEGLDRVWIFKRSSPEDLADALEKALPRLSPGPEIESEKTAAARTKARRLACAREFIQIAREAAGMAEGR